MFHPASAPALAPRRNGGLSATAIKFIAILAMVVDHSGNAFFAEYYELPALAMHMFGRITGPVMFYFIAEGTRQTRSPNRYTLRLALFAAFSYLPFIYYRSGGLPTAENWTQQSVIYTLLLGHLALRARREVKDPILSVFLVALCLILAVPGDWGILAVLYILAFDWLSGSFARQALGYTLITLTQLIQPLGNVVTLLLAGQTGSLGPQIGGLLVRCAYFLPLGLLWLYNGRRGAGGAFGKWFFYAFYPAHLLLIGWLRGLYGVY